MVDQRVSYEFRQVGDGDKTAGADLFYKEEIQLALRNRGMPLEGLRYDVTPTGMHYLLIHFDIPHVDEDAWTLEIGGLVNSPSLYQFSRCVCRMRFLRERVHGRELCGPLNAGTDASAQSLTRVLRIV